MIERAVYKDRGSSFALPGEVGERFLSSDCLFDGSIHRREQPALVIIARYPLNQAVVISRQGRQLPREKRIYIILPPCHATGGRLCIRDNGTGIDPKYANQIFDLGGASKLDKQRGGGPGYGLYLAKRIIESHGGEMSVDSKPGEGSTFCLTLPV